MKAATLSDASAVALPKDVETIVHEFATHIGQFDFAVDAIRFSEADAKGQVSLEERRLVEKQRLHHLERRLESMQALWREFTQQ